MTRQAFEPDETIRLSMSGPSAGLLANDTITLLIANDDGVGAYV